MRLLILTQYYPPEIGAPQNRLHELAVRLIAAGIEVEVLTAIPNYPKMEVFEEYRGGKIKEETIDGINVYRAKIFVSKSKGIIARLLNYFSFVWTSYWRGRKLKNQYDFLMVESPPLFLGYSAMALSRKLKARMIFNVSDLWPESAEKLGVVTNKSMLKIAYNLEAKCYKRASLITGQTQGIVDDIKERFPTANVHWLPNGVDVDFYDPSKFAAQDFRGKHGFKQSDVLFFYGGILGHAQGLELLIQAADRLKDNDNFKILLQGAGPEREKLHALKEELKTDKVVFLPPVPKQQMPSILKEVDVALVPLKKLDLFQGAIPSKIFEALAMKKTLLLGVEGEAKRHFIDKANAGLFFEPENLDDLTNKIEELVNNRDKLSEYGENGRKYVSEVFNRNRIAQELLTVLNNN